MKIIKKNSLWTYFGIGALLGAIFFVGIYGFGVLNVTNDTWLLTGRDLQQHYIGWKYFRAADWSFPLGMHDGVTYPYKVSVLYTDSIPLFAIFFKIFSPILPDTFQYFGLFGLMCFVLNGGLASVLIAKINKNKLICALGSVFFILSTPVLQRLFGLLSENSRHTSLAAHFLILGALGIWMYKEKFKSYWKAAIAFSVLGVLCVLIQIYIEFIVGGIMCGYLLHCILKDKDWKRCFIVFGSFILSSLLVFFAVGGLTDVLTATGGGFGFYSANLNALINPYNYSTFLEKMPWWYDQYEGFSYLGLGVILLYVVLGILFIVKAKKMGGVSAVKAKVAEKYKKHRCGVIPLVIVIIVFWGLALSTIVRWGKRAILQFYPSEKMYDLLSIVRSSGRFMWVIMYLVMLFGLYMLTRYVKNKKVQKILLLLCVCIQILDLAKPMYQIHKQYASPAVEQECYAADNFWKTKLGDYKYIVYYPVDTTELYQKLQVGTKASYFDMKLNYFYMSRFFTEDIKKKVNSKNKKLFQSGQLADDTIYITDYVNAHKYKDNCNLYQVDNMILAVKNPIDGLPCYNDVYVSESDPVLELDFSYTGLGKELAHNGWNMPNYLEDGMWTTDQSVLKVLSAGAKKVHISIEYEGGKHKGTTKVKMNGKEKLKIANDTCGTVGFDTELKSIEGKDKSKGVNWLFFNSDKTFKATRNGVEEERAIYIKKITISYIK